MATRVHRRPHAGEGVKRLVVAAALCAAPCVPAIAAAHTDAAVIVHDGAHDFDFDIGRWRTQSSRLARPLTGSTEWVELAGTTTVRPLLGGRANLAEFAATGPDGPLELLALRWYDPRSRQWMIVFATPGKGTLGTPGTGAFSNGRGDFYDQESLGGRTILVRFSIWGITADTARSEQAFSDDGGKTWEVNWINRYTRLVD